MKSLYNLPLENSMVPQPGVEGGGRVRILLTIIPRVWMGSESIAHETVTQLLRGENDSKQSDEIQARGIIIVLVKSN